MIERPDYDPEWGRRWRRAYSRFQALEPSASEVERRRALEAMYRAHDAQFRTVSELADFRFSALRRDALKLGYHLAMAPLPAGGTDADVEAAWRSAGAQLQALRRTAERRPLGQPEGLQAFSATPGREVVRRTVSIAETLPSGTLQHWTALIDQSRRDADVCLIPTGRLRGPFDGFAELATIVFKGFLASPWWRGVGIRPGRVRSGRPD